MPKDDKIVWDWWTPGEPEIGMLGFHTPQDRDDYAGGKPGPFRRRLSPTGKTILQSESWGELMRRIELDDGDDLDC